MHITIWEVCMPYVGGWMHVSDVISHIPADSYGEDKSNAYP